MRFATDVAIATHFLLILHLCVISIRRNVFVFFNYFENSHETIMILLQFYVNISIDVCVPFRLDGAEEFVLFSFDLKVIIEKKHNCV